MKLIKIDIHCQRCISSAGTLVSGDIMFVRYSVGFSRNETLNDSGVDMRGRVRMGSKSKIFRFFNSGYAHDRSISIFRRRASRVTGNTLSKPNYASVRQSRDSLHRDTHNMTKEISLGGAVL